MENLEEISSSNIDLMINGRFRVLNKFNDFYMKVEDIDENFKQKEIFIFQETDTEIKQVIDKYSSIRNNAVRKCERLIDNHLLYAIQECWTSINLIERLETIKKTENNIELFHKQIVYWLYCIIKGLNCLHNNNILFAQLCHDWIIFVFDEPKLAVNPKSFIIYSKDDLKEIAETETHLIALNSPEYLESKKIGLKYDIWTLGWLLYHMVTLENPFDYLNVVDDFKDETKYAEKSLLLIDGGVGGDGGDIEQLNELFAKMTRLESAERPTTDELLEHEMFKQFDECLERNMLENGRFKLDKEASRKSADTKTIYATDLFDNEKLVGLQRYLMGDNRTYKVLDLYRSIEHPNLSKIQHLFYDGPFFYSVEHLAETLLPDELERIKDDRKKHKETVVVWLGQLLSALNQVHRMKLIHKFIHVGRIGFVNNCIKLSVHDKSALIESHRQKHQHQVDNDYDDDYVEILNGEFGYFAPEIVNKSKCNRKYDIWSLGWVLFYMCTLYDMRLVLQEMEDFAAFNSGDFNLPDQFGNDLNQLFKKMISKEDSMRPDTVELLENDDLFDSLLLKLKLKNMSSIIQNQNGNNSH